MHREAVPFFINQRRRGLLTWGHIKVIVRAGGPTITKPVNRSMWSMTTYFQVFYLINTLIKT